MHKPSLTALVYKRLYPTPRPSDPTSFAVHISKNLVPEVRIETATFYGALDCIEAQYPGLDYSLPRHRMRLGRFPYHRRLFRVFDELGLTEAEISSLCHWEGTKWARERYEKDNGIKVRDTTGDEIPFLSLPPRPVAILHTPMSPKSVVAAIDFIASNAKGSTDVEELEDGLEAEEEDNDNESEEGEIESVGLALNQRLLAATEAINQGQPSAMDPEFEQWLKEAAERGSFDTVAGSAYPMSPIADTTSPISEINPINIISSYATRQSPATTSHAHPEPLSQSATHAHPHPAESILEVETIHRQTEAAM